MKIQLRHRLSSEMIEKEYESITEEDLIQYHIIGIMNQVKFIEIGVRAKLTHKELKKLIKTTL